jgi:hypothetical protein
MVVQFAGTLWFAKPDALKVMATAEIYFLRFSFDADHS